MTRLWLLLVLVVTIGATIALELRQKGGDEGTMPIRPLRPSQAQTGAAAPLRREAGWVDSILARPLFTPGRRPQAVGVAGPGGGPAPLPRVAGILLDGTQRRVIFAAATEGGRPQVVAEGGDLGGFHVRSIEAEQVTVVGPEGARVLRPSFDPRPAPDRAVGPVAPDLRTLTGIPGLPTAGVIGR